MLKSMTAYSRCEKIEENRRINIEIKSVNHRYSDITIKLPRHFLFLEEKIRKYIGDAISRGKIDVFLTIEGYGDQKNLVMVNEALAASYVAALKSLCSAHNLIDDISVSTVARYNDIFKVERQEEDEGEIWNHVLEVLSTLMRDFVVMRESEGERLKADMLSRADVILSLSKEVEAKSPETALAYKEKLQAKIADLMGNTQIDESRLLTEVAIFADKIATSEETVRLNSHIEELKNLLEADEPIGRKLDFIVQEMNREANTMGSKCNDIAISKKVVEIKSEIEKIREQIQNIE